MLIVKLVIKHPQWFYIRAKVEAKERAEKKRLLEEDEERWLTWNFQICVICYLCYLLFVLFVICVICYLYYLCYLSFVLFVLFVLFVICVICHLCYLCYLLFVLFVLFVICVICYLCYLCYLFADRHLCTSTLLKKNSTSLVVGKGSYCTRKIQKGKRGWRQKVERKIGTRGVYLDNV